jgi:uncharacterized protein YsxB (DUF464 family)
MTDVKIIKKAESITKVVCDGHTGYSQQGEDIVCAALSSVVQTALLGLLAVAKVNVKYKVDEANGYLEFTLPSNLNQEQRKNCDIILNTMLCGISDLREGYSDYINLEVK